MPSNHCILCSLLFLLLSIFPSIRVFSKELALHIRWSKYWSFSFSISPSNVYLGLISFRVDWFDILAVQQTLKNLFQHHSSKAPILQCSAFFMVKLSYPHMTTGKTMSVKSFSWVRLFVTPWTVALQAPLSMEFFRQEYWSLWTIYLFNKKKYKSEQYFTQSSFDCKPQKTNSSREKGRMDSLTR